MEENNYSNDLDNKRLELVLSDKTNRVSIGDKAPGFTANSTFGPIDLSNFAGKWVVLFSHPGDFTPVCTTEFIAFANMNPEFEKRDCQLIGLSIDSNPSHLSWVHSIHRSTGVRIPFPVISDLDMSISKKYGMIAPNVSNTQTVRNVYFIDPNQKIRAILCYPMTSGRNINEIVRLLDSMQLTDRESVVAPANWVPGAPTIMPSPKSYDELMDRINNPHGLNCMDWYLCFKDNMPNNHNQIESNCMTNCMNNRDNII